jgi:AmiR/NasT family two-component response regulator
VLAQTFAGYAAVALANAHLYATQRPCAAPAGRSMESSAVIEQANGIVMGDRRCSPDVALKILTQLSQDTNRKLRDVTTDLVADAYKLTNAAAPGRCGTSCSDFWKTDRPPGTS